MDVRDGMNRTVVTVGPGHTLREATRRMTRADVGAAVVIDPDGMGPGILTERDVLHACGAGDDLESELVRDHLTQRLTYAGADWSLERAAEEMVRARFRHVVVLDGSEVVGILSMRDIVRCWTESGAMTAVDAKAMESTQNPMGSVGVI
jgi:CBS domain-containing protein